MAGARSRRLNLEGSGGAGACGGRVDGGAGAGRAARSDRGELPHERRGEGDGQPRGAALALGAAAIAGDEGPRQRDRGEGDQEQ